MYAATAAVGQVQLRVPSPEQVIYPGRVLRIEWEHNAALPVDILFSTDRGGSWIPIATAVSGNGIEWMVPQLDTGRVLVAVQLTATIGLKTIFTMNVPDSVQGAWWNDPASIVTLCRGGTISQINAQNGSARGVQIQGRISTRCICPYPTVQDSVVVAFETDLGVVSIEKGISSESFGAVPGANVLTVAAHPTLPIVAVGYSDGHVRLWSIPERRIIGEVLSQALGGVNAIAFDPSGKLLAHSGADGVIIVEPWENLGSSTERVYLLGHGNGTPGSSCVRAVTFLPQSTYLASAGEDSTVRVWNYASWRAERVFAGMVDIVQALAPSADGSRLLAGTRSGVLYHWSLVSGEAVHPPLSVGEAIVAMGCQPQNDTVFVATASGTVSVAVLDRVLLARDSVAVMVQYPFGLKVGTCRGVIGDTVLLPIFLDRMYAVPYFEHSHFVARCTVVLPPSVAIAGNRWQYTEYPRRSAWDTVAVRLTFGQGDTVARIPLVVIAARPTQHQIRVLGSRPIEWEHSVTGFVLERVVEGEIVIDTLCGVQTQRLPVFTEDIETSVQPNPAQSVIELVFSAIESGAYRIELQSLTRGDAAALYEGQLERGRQRLVLNIAAFSTGAYRIGIIGPSTYRAVSLLIVW
ncbi:MAG: hypothetical protein N2663_04155 [Chlorobi bacterium]|nr:hypothetical protein [Chlorobiota bacterium]